MVREATLEKPLRRRPLDFKNTDEVRQEVQRLLNGGYRKAGNWDLAQMCDHLTAVMEGSIDGFRFGDWSWLWRRVLGPVAIRYVLWSRKMMQGLECPDPSFCPSGKTPADESVRRFLEVLKRVDEHTGAFKPHPALGKIDGDEWRQIHLIHAAHHFSFLIPE